MHTALASNLKARQLMSNSKEGHTTSHPLTAHFSPHSKPLPLVTLHDSRNLAEKG